MRWAGLVTPVGDLAVAVDEAGVCAVRFGPPPVGPAATVGPPRAGGGPVAAVGQVRADRPDPLVEAVRQLEEYLAGDRVTFTLPLSPTRGTAFERAVWAAFTAIPYGRTRTYGEIAATVGEPGAARAVGTACNRNPLPVLLPCHRVVGAGGRLVGFGGGLAWKRALLGLEARVVIEREFGSADRD